MKNYKIVYYLAVFLFLGGLISCEEEGRGPLFADSTNPGVITELAVTNLPGGAKIEYKLPQDEDALLVEASYERNGQTVTTRSSIFKNFVTIEGLSVTTPQEVSLVVIDRSDNSSKAVITTINPEKSPLDRLFDTFELIPDFGGVRLKYNNENSIKAELLLYTIDANGTTVYSQSAFIENDDRTHNTYRAFPPQTQVFGVAAIDRWNNITPITKKEILPKEEVLLDLQKFDDLSLTGDEPSAFGWVMPNLWNGNIGGSGFHTAQGNPGAIVAPYTEGHHMFTMDLGVKAQLSRFKFWLRADCCGAPYGHGDPRRFEVWGIDELPADDGASLEGWTRLVENGEVIKPSGSPIGQHSAEDNAQAAAGEEFEFPIEAPPVRYIRFVNFESWSGGKFMHFMEVNYWGQISE